MTTNSALQVLPPGAGYGIVIGIGGVFAVLMFCVTWLQNRYTSFSTSESEEFNTASRSIKPGLIASGIVSSWTWSTTLLTSSTFTYKYGVCGGMWYAANGCLQIMLFALIAIKIKSKTPGAHTFPEIILSKHGKIAHLTYLIMGLATNMLVGASLVLGGSQIVAALTGMNVYAACFLIPIVVGAYVIVGGLRSTFIADYVHTVILFIVLFTFGFMVYVTSDKIGSPAKFYTLLQEASVKMPISRNHEGSYLTFASVDGLVFAADLFVAGYACCWLDQAYWQRAIASRPESSVKAYLLGGIAWYGVPFGIATSMGLGCAALTSSPSFPTYPNTLTDTQVGSGLVAPAAAITLLGKGGAVLMLILLFMAVTSSTSAELIAVSSLLTFDVYKIYINPSARGSTLVKISHYGIAIYGLVLAVFCCILNAVGLDLTWLVTVLGILVGGAAVPVGIVLLWPRMSKTAAIAAPWIGLSAGLIAWFVTTLKRSGVISIKSSGDTTNAVAGNIASWGTGFLMAIVLTFIFPKQHVNTEPKDIDRYNKIHGIAPVRGQNSSPAAEASPAGSERGSKASGEVTTLPVDEKSNDPPKTKKPTGNEVVDFLEDEHFEPLDPVLAKEGVRLAKAANIIFAAIALILVPFTLYGTRYIFNRPFFTGFVVVSFIWVWVSMCICVIYPIIESSSALKQVSLGLWHDKRILTGQKARELGNV
ncbi:hypothetical protein E2P81_ATG06384 [Venturia nashicola]|nr:hypothetical protein E2P81_ATG06384 [Venturia nashicola]